MWLIRGGSAKSTDLRIGGCTIVDWSHVVLYCCFTVVTLRSCIMVLLYCCLFLWWLRKSSTVLFLVVSGKSSTVLAVLY